jgi:hypothetical protein
MSSVRCMFMFSLDVYNEGVANRKSEECSFVRRGASLAPIYAASRRVGSAPLAPQVFVHQVSTLF